ncbi:MAG TPA: YfhO family protein [Chthoniobacterales bacterium]|jgi:hypothetical protein|nr:YfhO family protein [Chthoniobacterales bacterium]
MDFARAKTSILDRLRAPGTLVAIIVTLLPLLYFLPATRGHLIISPDDGVIQNIPFRVAVANQIHAGSFPLWNPALFCGMPLLAAAQAGVLFPLNWFYVVFNPRAATNLMMLSAYMVAALGAYLCGRRSGSSVAGAGLTSLVWQASAFLVAQIGHTNIVHTAAALPWLFWAIDGYGQTGDRRRGLVVAIIVALQCFAGHQQTFVYALLVAAAYCLVMRRSTRARTYLEAMLLIVVGLALAAVQILPTLELLRRSLRSAASYDFFSSFSMPRPFIGTFVAPYLMGGGDGTLFRAPYVGPSFYAEYLGYVGLATLALALLALVLKRDARTIFWAAVIPIGLLLALGRYAPFHSYKLIYAVPVLNLFRVSARHLMEVEFALALLAGRGLTALQTTPDRARTLRWVGIVGASLFLLTCVAITLGRPADFHLDRNAPATIMRAPELFLPPAVALLTTLALWLATTRQRIGTTFFLVAVLYADLNLWGQFSGWQTSSPNSDSELWSEPAAFKFLRAQQNPESTPPYRVLTQDHAFDPDQPVSYAAPVEAWSLPLQPDICMMWGWENAAGYEGFGLARYSRLAGDMKVWGDLTDPEQTLRGNGRELDLLNVRYLLARSSAAATTKSTLPAAVDIPATENYGGQKFAKENFGLPVIGAGERLTFTVAPTDTQRIAMTTTLSWSENARDGAVVARIQLRANDGRTFDFELRAGEHSSEWAFDRPDINEHIKHRRAPIATSYPVSDAQPVFEGHDYVCAFELPTTAVIVGGEIMVVALPEAPQLSLNVGRISLSKGDRAIAVQKEQITIVHSRKSPITASTAPRWKHVADVGPVAIFENTRALPRAWLVSSELVTTEQQQLQIIRSGYISANQKWNPLAQALVERPTGISFPKEDPSPGKAEIARHEPNRVEIVTESDTPALLVLADNFYPGWRTEIDGHSSPIMRVNYNQRGVALSGGHHRVVFSYQPRPFVVGLLVSALSFVLLLWWMKRQPRVSEP